MACRELAAPAVLNGVATADGALTACPHGYPQWACLNGLRVRDGKARTRRSVRFHIVSKARSEGPLRPR